MNFFSIFKSLINNFSLILLLFFPGLVFAQSPDSLQVNVAVTCPGGVCAFGGCTDSTATNFNSEASYDDGSCLYRSASFITGSQVTIRGCTDSTATNFNIKATIDDSSCYYYIPNISNFVATKRGDLVRLSWAIPIFNKFSSVIIVKAEGRIPISHDDGEVIYNDSGHYVDDFDVYPGKTYYYLALVNNQYGNYSSGVVIDYKADLEKTSKPPFYLFGNNEEQENFPANKIMEGGSYLLNLEPLKNVYTETIKKLNDPINMMRENSYFGLSFERFILLLVIFFVYCFASIPLAVLCLIFFSLS